MGWITLRFVCYCLIVVVIVLMFETSYHSKLLVFTNSNLQITPQPTQLKGGEFPSLRYSDEETERLLAQAYAAIPLRSGKRGTLNLKREKRRWWIKRQYDARKKYERKEEHTRRMAKRHAISEMIYKTKVGAVDVRESERKYQEGILKRWAVMNGHQAVEDGAGKEVSL